MGQMILDVQAFLETGGDVLLVIGGVTVVMWTLMLERFYFFYRIFPSAADTVQQKWDAREDHSSWNAHQIRRLLVSELRMDLEAGLPYIRVLVALCPLLGLLGTVTGMIEVFDVMAVAGSGNAKASGLILSARLEQFAADEGDRLADRLEVEHGGDE
jgi:biopolymer transport protein ExbB